MPELNLHIDLPIRVADNARTRAVADDFEMSQPAAARLCVLEPTTVRIAPGELVYLVGASGSGKSQVLGAVRRAWPGLVAAGTLGQDRPACTGVAGRAEPAVLDAFGLPVEPTLRLLCLAGLAEPRLWLSPASCLSAGQADRLTLARLFAEAEEWGSGIGSRALGKDPGHFSDTRCPVTNACSLLAIDEFGSRLDRLTARVLGRNLRRWLDRSSGVAVIVATAHDDLLDALRPDQVWVKTFDGTMVQK